MWYDTLNEEWLEDEQDLYDVLYEIADDNRDYFDVDGLIDEMYPPFDLFGIRFYASEVIKKIDEMFGWKLDLCTAHHKNALRIPDNLQETVFILVKTAFENELNKLEKEHAAKAIECGYLYRENEMLYTKILVCEIKEKDNLFGVIFQEKMH